MIYLHGKPVIQSLVRECFIKETASQLGVDEGKPRASRVVVLDEFFVKERIFDTAVSELQERELLGIIEGCGTTDPEKYFTTLPDPEVVEVVVMDMHEPFRQAIHMCLPKVNIVTDTFHMITLINQALDKITQAAGLNTRFEWDENEVVIH